MENAALFLAKRGLHLTQLRRSVLELLYAEGRAIGAYDLTAAYEVRYGRRVRPNSVYRALDFLETSGLVVHLAHSRSYATRTPDKHKEQDEPCLFFVCSGCGAATECRDPRVGRAIRRTEIAIGFVTHMRSIDIQGMCKSCVNVRA